MQAGQKIFSDWSLCVPREKRHHVVLPLVASLHHQRKIRRVSPVVGRTRRGLVRVRAGDATNISQINSKEGGRKGGRGAGRGGVGGQMLTVGFGAQQHNEIKREKGGQSKIGGPTAAKPQEERSPRAYMPYICPLLPAIVLKSRDRTTVAVRERRSTAHRRDNGKGSNKSINQMPEAAAWPVWLPHCCGRNKHTQQPNAAELHNSQGTTY